MISSKTISLRSINPATLAVLETVNVFGEEEVVQVVNDAWTAFDTWQLSSFDERARLIEKFRRLLVASKEELANLVMSEVGKPLAEIYLSDLFPALDTCRWLNQNAEKLLCDQAILQSNPMLSSKQSTVIFEPLGVVGIISDWTYPFAIPVTTALFALMTGNAVVIKPSEKASLTGKKIAELFSQAGFPANVVSVITGDEETSASLANSKLAKLIFIGSTSGGIQITKESAKQVTSLTLQLSGKDAAIVLPDAPVEFTAKGLVWGAFTAAGQSRAAIERVYIVKGKKTEKLLEQVVAQTKLLQVGKPDEPNTDIGPLIDEQQFNRVVGQLEQAVAQGARILCGGNRVPNLAGYFFEPTVLVDVDHSMQLMVEDTMGPLLPIMVVDSEDQAVALANNCQFGLSASVWCKDIVRGQNVARDLNVGTVSLNDCIFAQGVSQYPWGGLKKSGYGKTHSYFGLLDLVNAKHVSIDAASGSNKFWWFPYGSGRLRSIKGGIDALHGSFSQRLKGTFNFIFGGFSKK
jgi:succinate-semialdehyde dehydrogenase/glutarate-semialdehyde dehydrogenase